MNKLVLAACAVAAVLSSAPSWAGEVVSVAKCTEVESERLQYYIVPDDMADYFNYIWVVDPEDEQLVRFEDDYFKSTLGSLEPVSPRELNLDYVHTVFQWFPNNHVKDRDAPIRMYLVRLPVDFVDLDGRRWRDVPVKNVNVRLPQVGGTVLPPIEAAKVWAGYICKLRDAQLS